jgi:hypothetical protein
MNHIERSKPLLSAYAESRPPLLGVATLPAALAALGGCAGLPPPPPDQTASRDPTLQRADSRSGQVGPLSVRTTGYVVRVSRIVARRYGLRGPIPGYLHNEVLGDGDASLAYTTTAITGAACRHATQGFPRCWRWILERSARCV